MELGVLLIFAVSYLVGSIPFGILFGKAINNIDPRLCGSGNIGFTNVLRVVGFLPAILTLLGDFGKGVLSAFLGRNVGGIEIGLVAGLFAILGHCYPIFLKFRGGKAIATSFGVLMALYPFIGLLIFVLWLFIVLWLRYVSLGSLVAFTFLPLMMILFHTGTNAIMVSIGITLLVYLRHRENIGRLLSGTENKAF